MGSRIAGEKWVKVALYLLVVYYAGMFCYNHLRGAYYANKTPARANVEASIEGLDLSSDAAEPGTKASNFINAPAKSGPKNPSWYPYQQNADVDTYIVHYGVIGKPSFRDTLKWWVGPWCSGEVQIPGHQRGTRCLFYRPIPSTIFWLQWNTLGFYEDRYTVWNHILAVPFMLMFVLCANTMFRRFCPAWSGSFYQPLFLLFAVYLQTEDFINLNVFAIASHDLVFLLWKNIPDLLVAIFLMIAATVFIWTTTRPIARWWHPILWIVPVYLACASKEVALLSALFMPLLDLPSWKSEPKAARYRLIWAVTYFIAFNVFRLSVLGGSGYRYGNNAFWYVRLINNLASPWGGTFTLRAWEDVVLAGSILLAILLTGWQCRATSASKPLANRLAATWLTVIAGTIAMLGCLHLIQSPEDKALSFAAGAVVFFAKLPNPMIILLVLVPALVYLLWTKHRYWAMACYGLFLLTEIPNSFSPGPMHRVFVPSIAWSWLFAMAFILALEEWLFPAVAWLFAAAIRRLKPKPELSSNL